MSIKKLLAAVSVAAIMTGSAHAQLALSLKENVSGGTDFTTAIELANEVDFTALTAADGNDGVFELQIETQGVVPPGQNLFLTIELGNGVFTTGLDGSEFLGTGAVGSGPGGVTGAVVDTGGAAGGSSVRYLITSDTVDLSPNGSTTTDGVSLNLPISLSSCADLTISVTEFETETANTAIEGGTASLAAPAVTCVDAIQASLAVDADVTTLNVSATPAFSDFVVAAPDTLDQAVLGTFAFTVDETVYRRIDGANAALVDVTDVTGYDASIDFSDTTGIASGTSTVTGTDTLFADAATAPAGNSIALAGTVAPTNTTESGTFTVELDSVTPATVLVQNVTASGATLSLSTANLYNATDAFTAADVEDLKLNGQYFGPFDWVSDGERLVNTIFRITGFDGLSDVQGQLIVQRARAGSAYNGTFGFDVLASDVEGSEVRMNSTRLQEIVAAELGNDGAFGTADVSLVFSTGLDLDVDRLLSGPSTAVVVPFGDNANAEGDQATNPTAPTNTTNSDAGEF